MQIISGLFDHMVLQRNRQNVSDTVVAGSCPGNGVVQLRVSRGSRALRGLNWISVGRSAGKKFTARLKGIPVGGPYDIDLRIVFQCCRSIRMKDGAKYSEPSELREAKSEFLKAHGKN